jgi:YggT family protein
MQILANVVAIYLVVLFARAIMSWFPPPASGSILATAQRVAYDLTEPVLAPVRRVIPPAGMFDISFMIVFFVLFLLQQYLAHSA